MTDESEVLRRLSEAVNRVGAAGLVGRPGLARNVLGDLFPDDQLAVNLLAGAVESGSVARLQDQAAHGDVAIVAPKLADALARDRGLVPSHARWAIEAWAIALDLREGPLAPLTTSVPAPEQPESTPGRGRRKPPVSTPAPVPQVPDDASDQTQRRPPVEDEASTTPWWAWLQTRRGVLAVAAAALLVVVVVIGTTVALTRPSIAKPIEWAMSARVVGSSDIDATISSGQHTRTIDSRDVALHDGDQIRVNDGTLEIRFGDSAVRLGENTAATYQAASKTHEPYLNLGGTGNVYAIVAAHQKLGLREPNDDHAELTSGRFASTCVSTCTYQTLDEPQQIHLAGNTMRMVVMQPHRSFQAPTASDRGMSMGGSSTAPTDSMRSSMSSASPSVSEASGTSAPASSGMSGMGGTNATAGTADADMTVVAPDALRRDPWIGANLTADADQHRGYQRINGRVLVGTWTEMVHRNDLAAEVHRPITFSLAHCDIGCRFTAKTTYSDPSGQPKQLAGDVRVGDAAGNDVAITYGAVRVACGRFGTADGIAKITDSIRFSSVPATGTRTVQFTADSSSRCKSAKQTEVPTAALEVTSGDDTKNVTLFTRPGATESNVIEHVRGGNCADSRQSKPGASADAICTPASKTTGGPNAIELITFESAGALTDYYDSIFKQSGLKSKDTGSCAAGACEHAVDGGRQMEFRSQYLRYDLSQRQLVVVSGKDRGQLSAWLPTQQDVSFSPLPRFGI